MRATWVLLVGVFGLGFGCADPVDDGSVTIFIEKTADRPSLTALDLSLLRADVIYNDGSTAAAQSLTAEAIDCVSPRYFSFLTKPETVRVDLTGPINSQRFVRTLLL